MRADIDRLQFFFIGNVIGLTLLIGVVVVTAPEKLRPPSKQQQGHPSASSGAAVEQKDSLDSKETALSRESKIHLPFNPVQPIEQPSDRPAVSTEAAQPAGMGQVVVTNYAMDAGFKIDPRWVSVQKIPAAVVPPHAMRSLDKVVGHRLKKFVGANVVVADFMLQ